MNTRRRLLLSVTLFVAAVALYLVSRPTPPPETPAPESNPSAVPTLPVTTMPEATPLVPKSTAPAPTPPEPLPPKPQIPVHRPQPLNLKLDSGPYKRQPDGTVFKSNDIERLTQLHQPGNPPEDDLSLLNTVVTTYRKIFRENPVAGENWEVVEALTGKNEYDLVFIDPAHPAINENGELTDRWGTPYRFHPISSSQPLEISSAGPDLVFGTIDDIFLEEPRVIGDKGVQ
ncbi:MAG: hypothetical protein AAGD22_10575 [Verrucomicrobiota bacterium]